MIAQSITRSSVRTLYSSVLAAVNAGHLPAAASSASEGIGREAQQPRQAQWLHPSSQHWSWSTHSTRGLASAAAPASAEAEEPAPLHASCSSAELTHEHIGAYYNLETGLIPEALIEFHQSLYSQRPRGRMRSGGCSGLQDEMKATQQSQLMYRSCMHTLFAATQHAHTPRLLLRGPRGAGKSLALVGLVEWARQQGWLVMYIPSALALTRGGYFTKRDGGDTWDTIISAQHILKSVYDSHQEELGKLQRQAGGRGTLLDLVVEGLSTGDNAAKAVDACLGLKQELLLVSKECPVLFAIDDYNALHWSTDYGTALHRLSRRQLRVEELTLACGLRMLQEPDLVGARLVVAETTSGNISPKVEVPDEGAAVYSVPRLNEVEIANALSYYHSRGLAPEEPSPLQVKNMLMLTNGNFGEVRQLACKATAYELGMY